MMHRDIKHIKSDVQELRNTQTQLLETGKEDKAVRDKKDAKLNELLNFVTQSIGDLKTRVEALENKAKGK